MTIIKPKKSEIVVGGTYLATINRRDVTVVVESIPGSDSVAFGVRNLVTGRRVRIPYSRFLEPINPDSPAPAVRKQLRSEAMAHANELLGGEMNGDAGTESPLARTLRRSVESLTDEPDTAPHLIVEARAGTGKSTTILQGVMGLCGIPTTITPSPQQQAVWDSIWLSKGKAKSVHMVAFNVSIKDHLLAEIKRLGMPSWVTASTLHGMGLRAVTAQFGRLEANGYVTQDIIAEILERDVRELKREKINLLTATEELVSLCKMNLVSATNDEEWTEKLSDLAGYYDVELNGDRAQVFELVPKVLERCKTPKGRISFDDMIWLPVVLGLPISKYDLLMVDEAQDLNRCQQALCKAAGRRIVLVGDPKQAIYGFAGADAESMPRMAQELPDCLTLPLTVTRRCGKAIVKEAKKYVQDFEAHESNCDGNIGSARYESDEFGDKTYHGYVNDGDMILCRVNSPLVKQCFHFLKAGRKANIQGRKIGEGLISTIKKLKAGHIAELIGKLGEWLDDEQRKENAKKNPNENRLINIQDRHDCLLCFANQFRPTDPVQMVLDKITSIFTDTKDKPGIRLSSIHKAKGLEAHRVFFLQPKGAECPHPMAKTKWQKDQELNLCYVAVTRAITELIYVT